MTNAVQMLQTIVVLILVVAVPPQPLFAQESSQVVVQRYALLVGCTEYPALDKRMHLIGPANDVQLARTLLTERFEFPVENVVTLADSMNSPDLLPTRANIEREWKRLADVAKAGDQILILMAGHGTQAPVLVHDEGNAEPDGLDEVFLPRDIGPWNDTAGSVLNGIRDDEIGGWIDAIKAKRASLWLIVDACHSGTMTRGADDEVKRELKPEDLGIPESALAAAEKSRGQKKLETAEPELLETPDNELTRDVSGATEMDANEPVVIALYAAQSIEPTVEKKFPLTGADRKYFGLLTYTLSQILTQADSKLTYRELVGQIHGQYVKMGRVSPTPVLEGNGIDREVLGFRTFPERSRITLISEGDNFRINAGTLSGISPGSILAVYPAAGQPNPDQILGHIKVVTNGPLDSVVEPCEYNSMATPTNLAASMRCETVFVDYGDQQLRIAIDKLTDKGEAVDVDKLLGTVLPAIDDVVEQNGHLLKIVPSEEADWLLRLDSLNDGNIFLTPVAGWGGDTDTKRSPLFGPAPAGPAFGEWLEKSLTSIARGQTLLRVSGEGVSEDSGLKVQIVRDGQPMISGRGEWQLYDEDKVSFELENTGSEPLDVTVLMIDSGFGIFPLYPKAGVTNRLFPKDKHSIKGSINATTTGQEHLVAIAVKAKGVDQPANFTFLSQPTLERTRAVGGKNLNSPLGDLLQGAFFGQGKTRGFDAEEAKSYSMQTLTWKTLPQKRSK